MSLTYSDVVGKDGILQRIEMLLGLGDGFITGDTTRKAQWTALLNSALDKAYSIIFKADGKWQFDDSNHTTYPILTGDLVSGQRDYSFTSDSDSNLVLDIFKVMVRKSTTDPYYEIYPADQQGDENESLTDGLNVDGQPYCYDKTATGLFLDPIPEASVSAGLKVFVNREGSYFVVGDTTKKPGFAGIYHEYLVFEPAYQYALGQNLANREALKREVLEIEERLSEFYSKRDRHDRTVMAGELISYE